MKTETSGRGLESLPLVPLRDMVVFPHMMQPFVVGRESSIRALEAALATPVKRLFLAAQRDPQLDDPSPEDIYEVGVIATVAQSLKLPNGHIKVMVEGVRHGKLATVTWEELHQRADVPPQDYSFRYFQQLDGSVMLPPDFTPQRVRVSLRDGDVAVDQTLGWNQGAT